MQLIIFLLRGSHPSWSVLCLTFMLAQRRCRLLGCKWKHTGDSFAFLRHLHVPSRRSHCIPGNTWSIIWKYLGKLMGHPSSAWVQNCSSTVGADKCLLWFPCTEEHSCAGFIGLFANSTPCVPVDHLKPWDPDLPAAQCCSAPDSAPVQAPCPTGEPLLHTANIPLSARVQRGCTDFQAWKKPGIPCSWLITSVLLNNNETQQNSVFCLESWCRRAKGFIYTSKVCRNEGGEEKPKNLHSLGKKGQLRRDLIDNGLDNVKWSFYSQL